MARPRLRRALRILRRIVLIGVGLVAIAIATVLIAVHTDWGRNRIRAAVVDAMAKSFPCGVSIGALEGDVLGDATLRDLTLTDCDGRTAVRVERVELNVELLALLDGTIRLEYLRVHGVAIDARQPTGGQLNLVAMFHSSPEPFGWDVDLPVVDVDRLAISLDLSGAVAHLDDLTLHAAIAAGTDGKVTASLSRLTGPWREAGVAVAIETDLQVVGGALAAPRLVVEVTDAGATPPVVRVVGTDLRYVSPTDARGTIEIAAAAGALARLFPGQPALPAVTATLAIAPHGDHQLGITFAATSGPASATGWLALTPTSPFRIAGVVRTTGADVHAFVPTAPATDFTGTIAFGAQYSAATAIPLVGVALITGRGSIDGHAFDSVAAHAAVGADTIHAVAVTTAPGEVAARVAAALVVGPDGTVAIERAHVIGRVGSLETVIAGAELRGSADVDVVASTVLSASPVITVDGTITGHRLRRGTLGAGRAVVELDHVQLDLAAPDRPRGTATAVITGGSIAGTPVPRLRVTATSRATGGYRVAAHTGGDHVATRGAAWTIDLDAVVHPGEGYRSATIELGDYAIRTDGVPWTGHGGRVVASRAQIAITGVTTTLDAGTVTVSGTIGLGGAPTDATARLEHVDLAHLDRALGLTARGFGPLHGDADLALELHRARRRLTGSIAGTVHGLTVGAGAGADPLEVAIDATFAPDRIAGTVTARGARLGAVTLALDVAPPRDPLERHGWATLDRAAIRTASVAATDVDLATLATLLGVELPAEGRASGSLALSATGSTAEIHAHDLIVAKVPGAVDLDATLDLATPGVVVATATAAVRDLAHGSIEATFAVPARPFDVTAWRALDVTALRGAMVTIDEVTIDTALANRLQLGTLRGRIAASITIAEAARQITTRAVARGVTGGRLARPVDLVIDGTLDAAGATATMTGAVDGVTVLTVRASAPIEPGMLALADRVALAAIPITGSGTLVPTKLAPLIRTFGEEIRIGGTIHGDGTVGGTLGDPTATARIVVDNLGGKRSKIDRLTIDASYAAGVVTANLDAREAAGTLVAAVRYDHAHPEQSTGSLTAHTFQLGPLVRFVPDLVGIRGVLDGALTLRGLDPATAVAEGTLAVREAQVPIADQIGAITGGSVDVVFSPGHVHLEVTGMIETGDVELDADAELDGLLPRTATIDVVVRDLAIISTLQPRIAGALHADVALAGDRWKVTARLSDGRVVIPDEDGKPLHAAGPPPDMVFIENGVIKTPARVALRTLIGRIPSHPFLVVALRIDPVAIVSKQLRGEVGGHLDLAIGLDGITLDGTIEARRGEVMVFDRRYLLSRAAVTFDGGLDPELDLQMSHDFAELALQVDIKGRLSNPELEFAPVAGYTQGQLLGFLLGGAPGGAAQDTREALTGAATAVASQAVSGFMTRRLPVKIDVLRFEPKTTSSSAAFVFGKWVTSKLLVLIRSRVEPREDENLGETELEIWLGRRVLLDAVGGDKGVLGLDLLWTRRW